jgi:methionine-R-sulfoxide reductase
VDSAADVLDCGVLQNLNLASLGIDLDIADMRALLRKRYQIAEVSKNHVYAPPPRFGPPRRPFTSPLLHEKRRGTFACAGCDLDLFSSTTKYDGRTGWPSFWAPLDRAVETSTDTSYGMVRTAVHCRRCDGHLGHVFEDGPRPTGLHYCMNGVAMTFKPLPT